MSKHNGLYKFVTCDTNEIIYIGKSNNNIKSRIKDHIRGKGIDWKFNAYKGNTKVFVAFLPNAVETDILERALINKYKPCLNVTDNEKGMSGLIEIKEPQWVEYKKAFPKIETKRNQKKPRKKPKEALHPGEIFLKEQFGKRWWLDTSYRTREENGRFVEKEFIDNLDEAIDLINRIKTVIKKHSRYNEEYHTYEVLAQHCQDLCHMMDNGMCPRLMMTSRRKWQNMNIFSYMESVENKPIRIAFSDEAINILYFIELEKKCEDVNIKSHE